MAYHQPFQVTGFHSCDREVGLRVLNGTDILLPSENKWDWLGMGIYFWEQNPGRALEYSIEVASGTQKNAGRIKNPFVIGAIIELEGGEIYENSNFTERLHIEIAVINPGCIKGYFLPQPISEFNPYLISDYTKQV